ncbi:MAG: VWA domain-containing protein [Lachnospiraceae bacterium]|nr:VWA domain-containing protein [Lachnospiraceae bacterium]
MSISFENPWYLLLIPVVALFLVITQRFMFTREKGSKVGQIVIRAILFLILILALSGFSLKFTGKSTTTIYLLDVSDSVRDSRQDIINFVNESVKDKKKNDNVGVIAFGEDTRVEQFVSENLAFSKFQTDVNTGATNLEDAVKIALSQLPDDSAGRIVLITDGNENEGSLKSVAPDIISSGCAFEIKKIEENISDEVYVSDLSIPTQAGIGEKFNIEVEVESNVACDAKVKLYAGRTLKGEQDVHLQKGTNQLIFSDTQSDEGLKTYKVVVESEKDTISVNNEFAAYTNIETTLPLMVVEGKEGNAKNYKKILESIDVGYDTVSPGTVPVDMPSLMQYSAVVLVDVYEADLREGFLDILNEYVKNNGGGLIITGGSSSYAVGGYRDTLLEEMAPVYMDINGENEIPTMAMAMVIDHSGSMDSSDGIESYLDLAKKSAAAAVDYMRPEDYVEVIAFDDAYSRVVPLQNVEDPEKIQQMIFSIPSGGGTSIYPALEAAVKDINNCDAMIKHIILLTDGQDYNSGYEGLLRIINNAGITLSCVAVGSGCNDQLLSDLATQGNGRIFYSDDTTDLPRIFAQEVFLASNTYLVNEVFTPEVTSNDKIIRDVVKDGMPQLYGYVATMKKERSIDLLESFQHDPILSYWQYGLGKTVAWTSDVNGEWSAEYSSWENTPLLWHNIIKLVSEDNGMEGTYANVEQNGNKATITYTTEEYSADTKVIAIVYDEEGNPKEVELDPKKPGVYEAQVDTKDTGIYTINVQQKDKGEIVSSINTAAIMQYSLEYRFYPENTLLDEFAASTGGIFIENPDEVFKYSPEFVKARFNLWIPLLIIAALLFLYDIAVRRFHLSFAFVDKMAANRSKNKLKKEEKKRKEAAEVIKADTVKETEEEKSGIVAAATKKAPEKAQPAPKGKIRQYVNENPQSAYTAPETPSKPTSAPAAPKPSKPAATDTGTSKEIPSFSSLKKPGAASEARKTETQSRVFERKEAAPIYFKESDTAKKSSDAGKNVNKSNDSVTSAALKTRVWIRDDD